MLAFSKKGLLLALFMLAGSYFCFAQDIIVTKDAKKIKAKVVRVNPDNVRYKDADDPDGQTHTILKKDIASILYEDGEVEAFDSGTTPASQPAQTQTQTQVQRQTQTQRPVANANRQTVAPAPMEKSTTQAMTEGEDVRKTRWGVKGGLNVATVALSNSNYSASFKNVVGAVVGVTLEHAFTPEWFFHSGLEASMKGFDGSAILTPPLKATAIYILLPAAVGYKFDIGKGWKLEVRAGLYAAYGIAGSTTASGYTGSMKTFGDKILNPFDCGGLGGAFFDNGGIVLGIHGEMGFTETNGDVITVTGATATNSNVSFTVGYLF